MTEAEHESRTKLRDAAVSVIRAKGYSAARVDDICLGIVDLLTNLLQLALIDHFTSPSTVS